MKQAISMEMALETLARYVPGTGSEEVSVVDAFERILAKDIVAGISLPPFRRSPLDGYALRAADTIDASRETPVVMRVVDAVFAGQVATMPIGLGEAMSITTGAPMPEGSDCVVKFEDIVRDGETIAVSSPFATGENVVPQGEDVAEGETVINRGSNITPAVVGLLVSLGLDRVQVFKKPRVGVLSIGDELLEVGHPLRPGKIYNSNLYALSLQVKEAGGLAFPNETLSDSTGDIARALERAMADYDLVVTTGGASVGSKDLVRDAIRLSGAGILFWKVGMKPGTPAVCGEKDGKLIIGLSGNPSAAMITFLMLVRPLIRTMAGKESGALPEVSAVMKRPFHKTSSQRRLLRSLVAWENGRYFAIPAGIQSPGALKSMVECNALIDIPAGHGPLEVGAEVKALLLPPPYCLQG
ncbi:gephyrin-like molybdotransferase Glp [Desulfuromonas sp. CSMB_57]|uniref:molybdopterin molybdotransferase MoeA n=1 Tax=Desulfuromonas sp. CSMB_57 TaxID=2807629 RepID=UPI001CD7305E|nr:gephyrin-like molybdotransferase Glp [Desulfuromonas sp. CSMB_57]